MTPILFNQWELLLLQDTVQRWDRYKGVGSFSDVEHQIITGIVAKVQVDPIVPISFTSQESNFLQSLFTMGQQDYGRGSGSSVFETGVRGQVRQRTVQLTANILAKLRGTTPPFINPTDETNAMEG